MFSKQIDKYRNINYNNLISSSNSDFDWQIISNINNISFTSKVISPWWSQDWETLDTGLTIIKQTVTIQNKDSTQSIFNINFAIKINISKDTYIDSSMIHLNRKTTTLQFYDLNNLDITFN